MSSSCRGARGWIAGAAVLLGALSGTPGVGSGAPEEAPGQLQGPIPLPLILTSSFGEYRSGHYHGGLDYSTGGRTGIPVLAPGPGWVWRVRASGVGYGKAIYYRLDDGRTAVYAHLSGFHPEVEAYVRREQDRAGAYEVDLRPGPGKFRFAGGDTLGATGQSGAGPPHLHAEIRTGDEATVAANPALYGWAVADTVAPVLTRLRVAPAQPGVRVNGGVDPVILDLGGPAAPLVVDGPVRMWLEVADRTVERAGRLAPYQVARAVDGELVSEIVFNRVDWRWPAEVEWTFDEAAARLRDERWVCLDPAPNGRQGLARWSGGHDSFPGALAPGSHRMELRAADTAGNVARRALTLVVAEPSWWEEPIAAVVDPEITFLWRGSYLEIRGPSTGHNLIGLAATHQEGAGLEGGWFSEAVEGGRLAQLQMPRPARPGLWTFDVSVPGTWVRRESAIWARAGGPREPPLEVETRDLWISLPPGALYEDLWIGIGGGEGRARPSDAQPDLVPVSAEIALEPWAEPLRAPVRVALVPPDRTPGRGLGLYRWDDGWSFVGADTLGPGIGGTIHNLETLALLRDETPPRITLPDPGEGRRLRLRASIEDGGAGFTWRDLAMTLDGETVIAEWDPDASVYVGHLRGAPAVGDHVWEVRAADRAGNEASAARTFTVR